MHTIVSTSAALLGLAIAAALWFPGQRSHLPVVLALVITGFVWLLDTRPGAWIRDAIEWSGQGIGRLVGTVDGASVAAGVVMGASALLALGFVYYHTWKRQISERTFAWAGLLVFTATSIGGPVGHAINYLIFGLADIVSWPLAWAFGLL
jgi:hypothetical protein